MNCQYQTHLSCYYVITHHCDTFPMIMIRFAVLLIFCVTIWLILLREISIFLLVATKSDYILCYICCTVSDHCLIVIISALWVAVNRSTHNEKLQIGWHTER